MKTISKFSIGCIFVALFSSPCRAESPIDHMHNAPTTTPSIAKHMLINTEDLHATYKILAEQIVLSMHLKNYPDKNTLCNKHADTDTVEVSINTTNEKDAQNDAILAAQVDGQASTNLLTILAARGTLLSPRCSFIKTVISVPALDTQSMVHEYNAEKGTLKITVPFKKN